MLQSVRYGFGMFCAMNLYFNVTSRVWHGIFLYVWCGICYVEGRWIPASDVRCPLGKRAPLNFSLKGLIPVSDNGIQKARSECRSGPSKRGPSRKGQRAWQIPCRTIRSAVK